MIHLFIHVMIEEQRSFNFTTISYPQSDSEMLCKHSISYIQLNFFYELNAFTPYPVLKCFYIRTEGAHDPGNSANMVTIIRQRERVNLMVHI